MANSPEDSRTAALERKRKYPSSVNVPSSEPYNPEWIGFGKRLKLVTDADYIPLDDEDTGLDGSTDLDDTGSSRRVSIASGVSKESGEISTDAEPVRPESKDSGESSVSGQYAFRPRQASEVEPISDSDRYHLRPQSKSNASQLGETVEDSDLDDDEEDETSNSSEDPSQTAKRIFTRRAPSAYNALKDYIAPGRVVVLTMLHFGNRMDSSMQQLHEAFAATLAKFDCDVIDYALPPRKHTMPLANGRISPDPHALLLYREASFARLALFSLEEKFNGVAGKYGGFQVTTSILTPFSDLTPRFDEWATVQQEEIDLLSQHYIQVVKNAHGPSEKEMRRKRIVDERIRNGQRLGKKDFQFIVTRLASVPASIIAKDIHNRNLKAVIRSHVSNGRHAADALGHAMLFVHCKPLAEQMLMEKYCEMEEIGTSTMQTMGERKQSSNGEDRVPSPIEETAALCTDGRMQLSDLPRGTAASKEFRNHVLGQTARKSNLSMEAIVRSLCFKGEPFCNQAQAFVRAWDLRIEKLANERGAVAKKRVTPASLSLNRMAEILSDESDFSRPMAWTDLPPGQHHPALHSSVEAFMHAKQSTSVADALVYIVAGGENSGPRKFYGKPARSALDEYFGKCYLGELTHLATPRRTNGAMGSAAGEEVVEEQEVNDLVDHGENDDDHKADGNTSSVEDDSDGGASVGDKPDVSTYDHGQLARAAASAPAVEPTVHLHEVSEDEARLQARYFGITDPKSYVRCLNCFEEGHMQEHEGCPARTCQHCGAFDQHSDSACPARQKCTRCRLRGHNAQICKLRPVVAGGPDDPCNVCERTGHVEEECADRWRGFIPNETNSKRIPAHQMLVFCYNCGRSGHWGDDCPRLPSYMRDKLRVNGTWSAEWASNFIEGAEKRSDRVGGRNEEAYQLDAFDDRRD